MTEMIWISSGNIPGARRCCGSCTGRPGDTAYRVEFFGDEIDRITEDECLTGEIKYSESYRNISGFALRCTEGAYGKRHIKNRDELEEQVTYFKSEDKLLRAQRIASERILIWK